MAVGFITRWKTFLSPQRSRLYQAIVWDFGQTPEDFVRRFKWHLWWWVSSVSAQSKGSSLWNGGNRQINQCTLSPLAALRCGVQFLGNIAVGNQLCKDDIWELGFPHIFRWVNLWSDVPLVHFLWCQSKMCSLFI